MNKTFFLAISILISIFVKGQDICKFQFGGGLGIGLNYIKKTENVLSNNNIQIPLESEGFFMNYTGHISLSYTFKSRFGLRGILEIAHAPAIIYTNNESDITGSGFLRFSPGASLFYSIPITEEMSFNPEIGLFYHAMKFNGFNANTISPKTLINIVFVNDRTFRIEGFFGLDFVKAKTSNQVVKSFNFTGLFFGAGFSYLL